jgi:Helix-turn-helix domain
MSFRSPEEVQNEFGIPGKSIKLTDPETMRALAHPARIALWQHLLLEGPATATECAPVADLSPSACSYHLRQLARFGFVEQDQAAAANGRERPWRAVISSTTVDDLDDPVAVMAARLLDYSLEERWQAVRSRYENSKQDYPAEWRQAAGGDRSVLYATADELAALREQIRELYRPLIRLSGQERPDGARPVQGAIDFVPLFGPADISADESPAQADAATGGSASTGGSAATDGADR